MKTLQNLPLKPEHTLDLLGEQRPDLVQHFIDRGNGLELYQPYKPFAATPHQGADHQAAVILAGVVLHSESTDDAIEELDDAIIALTAAREAIVEYSTQESFE